jgi:hypothetical protein
MLVPIIAGALFGALFGLSTVNYKNRAKSIMGTLSIALMFTFVALLGIAPVNADPLPAIIYTGAFGAAIFIAGALAHLVPENSAFMRFFKRATR